MKRLIFTLLINLMLLGNAQAVENRGFIEKINYLDKNLIVAGLPDYPPFSVLKTKSGVRIFESAFILPLRKAMKKYGVDIEFSDKADSQTIKMLMIEMRAGLSQLFIGANSDTKMFTGLELIYPAVVTNPIHLITLVEKQGQIKSISDLEKLKGVACSAEYFSDFVTRKLKEININFVDTPYDAYEKLFKGEADYMMGSLYYNKIMASRFGIGKYLTYSKNPIYKIPVFLALSPVMPKRSEYQEAIHEALLNPEFARNVKEEIIRIVEEEIKANDGIVPPSFAQYQTEEEKFDEDEEFDEEFDEENNNDVENNLNSGHIVEHEVHQRTMEEVLEGL
ncbi:MAG: transporter substrate-binding domain-containing protein [Alphaproteobacteria bacterium]|nr:transporter substrate-binding domain-containing protein [Alphaproteobacteria bacterium]